MLSIIAIIGKNRELGKKNKLIWNIPEDLARFRSVTKGHPVIMGRKTFESIGHPLPNRTNIIVSKNTCTLDDAIEKAKISPGSDEIFIIGGASVYLQAIEKAERLYLTLVDSTDADADAFFPEYEKLFTKEVFREPHFDGTYHFTYLTLDRG